MALQGRAALLILSAWGIEAAARNGAQRNEDYKRIARPLPGQNQFTIGQGARPDYP